MWSQAQSEVYKMPDIPLGESQIDKKKSATFKILPQVIGACAFLTETIVLLIQVDHADLYDV